MVIFYISNDFWSTLDKANQSLSKLAEILEGFSRIELIEFQYNFDCAVLHIAPDREQIVISWNGEEEYTPGDDSIDEISQYIVGKGRDYFESCLNNVEAYRKLMRSLYVGDLDREGGWDSSGLDDGEFAGSMYPRAIAGIIFDKRYNEELHEIILDMFDEEWRGYRIAGDNYIEYMSK